MKNFVKLIQQVHEERFSVVMNRIVKQQIPVAFLSTAPTAKAVETVKNLRARGLNTALLIVVDNTPPPGNLNFLVVHLSQVAGIYPKPEYIFGEELVDVRVALKNFPASKVLCIHKKLINMPKRYYQAFMTHLDELREVYESLIDEISKKTFCGYWLGRITTQLGEIAYSNAAHYLINGFIPKHGAIVIDCGVFDGGTSAIFSDMGYRVYGFEMDEISYERSLKVAEEKNFVLENLGLGSYKHMANYDVTGKGGNKLNKGGSSIVEVTTIDAYVREKHLPCVDFIKMDVEGAELDILKGAKTSITRFKPILAISAYHKPNDFWTLMNFVKSIRSDYEFAMRQSYETMEEEPFKFNDNNVKKLLALGLDPSSRSFGECVLFAR